MALLNQELATLGVVIPGPVFAIALAFHVLAGIICVITGAIAATARKRAGRHPRFGTVYYVSLSVAFAALVVLSVLRWGRDWPLFTIGLITFSAASLGYVARRRRRAGWMRIHIWGMSLSYIGLFTGFYVDNGPHLPLWDRLPTIAFWLLPSCVGVPLILRALAARRLLLHSSGAGPHEKTPLG